MALRNIIKFGDPILEKTSRKVEKFDERLFELIDDMEETLEDAQGVGLAAVQVGVLRRVIIVKTEEDEKPLELINPEITYTEGEQREQEGCLSLPDVWKTTLRPEKVQLKAQDRNGVWHTYTGEGLKARAFCHETDHLDGILFTSHVIEDEESEEGESEE